jgi:ribosomal protein S18 acetylase RimI-like enzyme
VTISFRPLTEDDFDQLAVVFTDGLVADGQPISQSPEELREEFESVGVDLSAHTFSAWNGGRLLGAVYTHHAGHDERHEFCYVLGTVHPSSRGQGIGRALLRDGIAAARVQLQASTSGAPQFIRAVASSSNVDAMRLFGRSGFVPVRYFADLHRSLDSLPDPQPSGSFVVVPWDLSRNDEVLEVKNLAFRDHWGSSPISSDHWVTKTTGFGSRPDLSCLALAPDGAVVGYLLSHRYEDDDALLGAKYGWIDNIGTLAAWRRKGIASQLITTALHWYREAGLEMAAIDVDTENPSGAHRLYGALGFQLWRQTVMFQCAVEPGGS